MQWGAPQLLVNVTDSLGELTETALFCVNHLLPSLMSNWCQLLERGKLQHTSYLEPRLDGVVEGLWKTLVRACLLFAWAVLAVHPAVQPRLQPPWHVKGMERMAVTYGCCQELPTFCPT